MTRLRLAAATVEGQCLPVRLGRLQGFAWAFLAYTVAVVVWGAYVRASLSGDGCGAHWPICNGQLIPVDPSKKTIIEMTHRVTSGLCLIGTVVLLVWTRRVFDAPHAARRAAAWSLFFMVTEALVGASIVLLRMVADNPSTARGYWMAAHLMNTFVLLAWLTLTARAIGGGKDFSLKKRGRLSTLLKMALVSMLLVGVTGAIAALGDTLFPVDSLQEGLAQELSPDAHPFVALRIIHPIVAVFTAAFLLFVANQCAATIKSLSVARYKRLVVFFVLIQLVAGLLNWLLLAPIWMQLVHLLIADAVWIVLVLLTAESLQDT